MGYGVGKCEVGMGVSYCANRMSSVNEWVGLSL